MNTGKIILTFFWLLIAVNPVNKIFILAVIPRNLGRRTLRSISLCSTAAALLFMLLALWLGMLGELPAFRSFSFILYLIMGGMLIMSGIHTAVTGNFIEKSFSSWKLFSIIPLAIPLIAGPGSVAICLESLMEHGLWPTCFITVAALLVNMFCMLFADSARVLMVRFISEKNLVRLAALVFIAGGIAMICCAW